MRPLPPIVAGGVPILAGSVCGRAIAAPGGSPTLPPAVLSPARRLEKARPLKPFDRLTIVQPPRLKLGLVLVLLLAFVFSYLPNLSAARNSVAKSAVGQRTGKAPGRTKVATKSTGTAKGKPATKNSTTGSAKSRPAKSAGSAKGSPKGSPKRSLRDSPGSSKKGSSRAASKRSRRTVYRQQQPEPERIREIQQALADHGYPLEVNGAWDASTVEALKKFQTDQNIENLSGKGKLDSMTLIALGLGPKREPPSSLTEAPKQTPEGK